MKKTSIYVLLAHALFLLQTQAQQSWQVVNIGTEPACVQYFHGYDYWQVTLAGGSNVTLTGAGNPLWSCGDTITGRYFCGGCDTAYLFDQHEVVYTCGGLSSDMMIVSCSGTPPNTNDRNDGDHCPSGSCCGMPVWRVSEPYISLWLDDEPLGYQPGKGDRITFHLAFKQREFTAGQNTNIFSCGKNWNFAWFSMITLDTNGNPIVHFETGLESTFTGNAVDYQSSSTIAGATNSGFTITYPDGSKDIYNFIVTNGSGIFQEAMRTTHLNAVGQTTTFAYSSYNPANPVVRLEYVVDADGRTNTVYYNPTNAYSTNLISQVVDPFGRATSLAYDSNGHLTNIMDVQSLSSSLTYDANDWVQTMTTPYGTTTFQIVQEDSGRIAPDGRYIRVIRPDGGVELYLGKDQGINDYVVMQLVGTPASYTDGTFPTTSPYFANTINNNHLVSHNTYHWGARQYHALTTTNINYLNTNDFLKAEMTHWLLTSNYLAGNTPAMHRDPSPDAGGAFEGQKTWYDYAGKTNLDFEGTQKSPLLVAKVLPDGTTWFVHTDRNAIGNVLTNISTYSSNGVVALRTNINLYDSATGIDLLSSLNPLGLLVSSNIYNTNHQVTTNYDALNQKTVYLYNTNQELISTALPTGLIVTNIYDSNGFLANTYSYSDLGGVYEYFGTNIYTYASNLVATHLDSRGLLTTHLWDNLQRLIKTGYPDGTYVTNAYSNLDLVMRVDRLGFTNKFAYDSMRRETNMTDALGRSTKYFYCTCGSLESIIDPLGNPTYFSYDNQGRKTNSLFADGYSLTMNYDLLGRLTNSFDSAGRSVTNWFNNQGLVFAVNNYFGQVKSTTFDIIDRATNSVDANGVVITNTYDTLNRLVLRGYPDGGTELFAWTNTGLIYYTNQLSEVTAYGYDAAKRKTAETNANLETNGFVYDAAGDLLTLTDGKGQTTTWTYDIYGQVSNKVDAASNLILAYHYDADYRLTNRWSATKGNIYYSYDRAGNLTNINYPVNPAISIAYDALNRPTNMVDAVGSTSYGYDAVGQLLSEDGPWASDTVSYGYTARMRTSLSLQQPNADPWNQTYGYDGARRLTNTASPAGSFGYTYDSNRKMLVSDLSLPNTANITNAYDANARLLGTALVNSGGTNLDAYTYTYNVGNQRTTVTRTLGDVVSYGYDGISQLTSASAKELGGVTNRLQEQFGYGYDAAHNLEFRTNNALIQTFNLNSLNELTTVTRNSTNALTVAGTTGAKATSVTVNGLAASNYNDATFAEGGFTPVDGNNTYTAITADALGRHSTNSVTVFLPASATYTYDLNGNLLSDGTRNFNYDDENQLTNVWVTNAWMSQFVYDGRLRRRIRKEFAWQSSAWVETNEVHYVYDDNLVIQERDINNMPLTTYTRGNDLSSSLQGEGGISGLLAMSLPSTVNPQHYYYHADGNGNITALINSFQSIVAKYLYDPYGKMLSLSGQIANLNLYRFSSKEYHLNSALVYFLYRFYDSDLQRWVNRDPMEELGGINLYTFVANTPNDVIDAFGLLPPVVQTLSTITKAAADLDTEEGAAVAALFGKAATDTLIIGTGTGLATVAASTYVVYEIGEDTGLTDKISDWIVPQQPYNSAPLPLPAYPQPSNGANGTYPGGPLPAGSPDPITLPVTNPGRDNCGKCNPCPPNSPAWEVNEPGHGSPTTHWHWIEYHQDKNCECHPIRRSSPTKPPGA